MEDATVGLPHHVQLPLPAHNTDNPQVPTDQNEFNYRNSRLKGPILPDWICMRVVPLDRSWKGHQPLLVFYFYFWSLIVDKSSKFWAASCKNKSNLLLVWITVCMCSNHDLFRRTVLQKRGRDINCSLDYGSWVKNSNIPAIQTKIEQHFWGIFSLNKSVSANRKTGFYANCDPNKQEVEFIFAWSGSEFSNIQEWNKKK